MNALDALKEQREQLWSSIDALLEVNASLRANIHAVRDELAKHGPSCDRCQSSHCCSVAGCTPPLCVTDPEGSLPLWMPWTNEDVRERLDAVYAQVDALHAELARVRRNHLRRMKREIVFPSLEDGKERRFMHQVHRLIQLSRRIDSALAKNPAP